MMTPAEKLASWAVDLDEWRANPVTMRLREVTDEFLEFKVQNCKDAAWAGTPWPEERREGLKIAMDLIRSLFEGSAEDLLPWNDDDKPMESDE